MMADSTNLMPATARQLQLIPLGCLAHNCNLVLKDLILTDPRLTSLCGISSLIVASIHRSSAASANIKKRLTSYVVTRFYSFLECISSIDAAKDEIRHFATQLEKDQLLTAIDDFCASAEKVTAVVRIMTPFKDAFTRLSAEKQPTGDQVILILLSIRKQLERLRDASATLQSEGNLLAGRALELFNARFQTEFARKEWLLCAALNPIARQLLSRLNLMDGMRSHLKSEMRRYRPLVEEEERKNAINLSDRIPLKKRIVTPSFADDIETVLFDESQTSETDQAEDRIEREIESFFAVNPTFKFNEFQILEFWKVNSSAWPILSRVARAFLCIPATSLACERSFSMAGNMNSSKRNRMLPGTINQRMRIKFNKKILESLGITWWRK